jgi:hypothetical protein
MDKYHNTVRRATSLAPFVSLTVLQAFGRWKGDSYKYTHKR